MTLGDIIKPENIVLVDEEWPVLVDFGLVSLSGEEASREVLTIAGAHTEGTIDYMAPEQIRAEVFDARADLYAMGVVLYELVTGHKPFRGNTPMDVLGKHLHETPLPPSAHVGGLPRELDDLILALMAKAPADRIGHRR